MYLISIVRLIGEYLFECINTMVPALLLESYEDQIILTGVSQNLQLLISQQPAMCSLRASKAAGAKPACGAFFSDFNKI